MYVFVYSGKHIMVILDTERDVLFTDTGTIASITVISTITSIVMFITIDIIVNIIQGESLVCHYLSSTCFHRHR